MVRFESGRLCLDLLATGAYEGEQLCGAAQLDQWLLDAGLLPCAAPRAAARDDWPGRFVELRRCVGALVHAELGARVDGAPAALDRVNALAAVPPPGVRAVRGPDGRLARAPEGAPECGALLAAIARDALDLLTDPTARTLLRQCEGDSCRLLYLDTSRGRRRRWCSSEACGNRERVARHRRRVAAL
ncbi:ABATE domain-containing protein [Streptomyces sp. NBC_00083]|uniref:CGNR zinc finger domain-containing protein n=1 Tax=Streptomyces sp. NBC_00083 TaxID=2975647 RepID=UPI0022528707|nr:ABATE domain-containing protein [Streptomyces sp. NBC_00083]MCX5382146.1 ABATE domain-containing protein [Streptomyces sp. NBC_00083]